MGKKRTWTVARLEDVQRLIGEGLSDRQIARTIRCRRTRVKDIRENGNGFGGAICIGPGETPEPAWASRVEWMAVVQELGRGFEIKRVWEERAAHATSHSNFFKFLWRRYRWLLEDTVTLREFAPGSQAEVDWAGDKVPWWDSGGHRREAHVFVGILCHSQLVFAWAAPDERRTSWLTAHQKMFTRFGGVPRVTVPDNLKTGVSRHHLYDPDLNPAYTEFARHYGTAVVPARVRRPKDKALVENAVGIVMRLFRWTSRNQRFHSIQEINEALTEVLKKINERPHSRFKTSRQERFERLERDQLKPLPMHPFEDIEWRTATVHPDCTIVVEATGYSVPHVLRGKKLRVKLTARQVEIFSNLNRVAIHARDRSRMGRRVIDPSHLPSNSQAYLETTPRNVLSQARFLNHALYAFIDTLMQEDALAHLRRAQGLIRGARNEINRFGRADSESRITEAVAQMQRFAKHRVRFFTETIERLRKQKLQSMAEGFDRKIDRIPGNPMLRATSGDAQPGHSLPNMKGPL